MALPLIPLAAGAAGAGIGALINKLTSSNSPATESGGSFLTGSPARTQQFSKLSPQQQSILEQLLTNVSGKVQGNQFDFGPIEQQARTGFAQKTLPTIAERFTAMGRGAQQSSAFPQILGQAGAGLEENLAVLRSKYNLEQQGQLQRLLGALLSPQLETSYIPSSPGFLQSFGSQVAPAIGQLGVSAARSYFGF